MKEIKIKQFDIDEVNEITLLSIGEARCIDKKFLGCGDWWWLRSPGHIQMCAATVSCDGSVYKGGNSIYKRYGVVRPIFRISNLEIEIGEPVKIGKTWCTVVKKDFALANYPICKHKFDEKSNEWETSELKKFMNSEEFISLL